MFTIKKEHCQAKIFKLKRYKDLNYNELRHFYILAINGKTFK